MSASGAGFVGDRIVAAHHAGDVIGDAEGKRSVASVGSRSSLVTMAILTPAFAQPAKQRTCLADRLYEIGGREGAEAQRRRSLGPRPRASCHVKPC